MVIAGTAIAGEAVQAARDAPASAGQRVSPGVIATHAPESYQAAARLAPLGRVGQISDIVDGIGVP
jgi:hypothetical protein